MQNLPFSHTGYYAATMTTFEDPLLKVIENDNGNTWTISFYCGMELIDGINLEYHPGTIDKNVLTLPVYDAQNDYKYLGTLKQRLTYAKESFLCNVYDGDASWNE